MSRGYVCSVPLDQAAYDLVVESDVGLKRVQVKTTTSRDQYGRTIASVHKKVYDPLKGLNSSGKRRRAPYDSTEVDYFFILTESREVYLIPLEAVQGKLQISLDRSYISYKYLGV